MHTPPHPHSERARGGRDVALGTTLAMVLQGQDAWRQNPVFQTLWRRAYPRLNTALVIFAGYCIAEVAYYSVAGKSAGHGHDDHGDHGAHGAEHGEHGDAHGVRAHSPQPVRLEVDRFDPRLDVSQPLPSHSHTHERA